MTQDKKFWDKIAKRYFEKPIEDLAAYEMKLDITRDYFKKDMTVLEIGCGTGGTALSHAPFVNHIDALDISSEMLAYGEAQALEKDIRNVEFIESDISDFDAPDASYDAIMAMSLLHLVEDRDVLLDKIHRLLKPGGMFISSTTCLGDLMPIFKWVGPLGYKIGLLPKIRVFTLKELENSLSQANFKIIHHWHPGQKKAVFMVAEKES